MAISIEKEKSRSNRKVLQKDTENVMKAKKHEKRITKHTLSQKSEESAEIHWTQYERKTRKNSPMA